MQKETVKENFDNMASSYDAQWEQLSAINDSLHLLLGGLFTELKDDANILCVGAGTGAEIIYLAQRFPGWRFTAVEPSTGMIKVCKERLSALGLEDRCSFHSDYLETLPISDPFDAATSLLVSQFILEQDERINFFSAIADRLKPGGILASTDLSADLNASSYQSLLQIWLMMMKHGGVSPQALEGMKNAYGTSVSVMSANELSKLIQAAGFDEPTRFYQVGLINGWYCRKGFKKI
ncbi:class I SAM-dependent methyltransferase [Sessilibacter corallicola]|uniref:Class I SAM-dependent methyltransferase n=1 Tax=Sessilibacter corallicola TaxID=2904075 RepID=A0ABQ0AF43_9GAMM